MKSVLISIKPKWCELIAQGKKTVEVRKTRPKMETPFKCYIYMTKGETLYYPWDIFGNNALNGKVIGEFVCDRISELAPINRADEGIEKQACLSREQIVNYLRGKSFGWHISDLVIYDKPRELKEFSKYGFGHPVPLKRPPQSWMYVESEENDGT